MKQLLLRIRLSVSLSALLTLTVSLALTALLFTSIRTVETARSDRQFQQDARLRTSAVASGLADAVEQLQLLNQLFRSVGAVDQAQFHSFAAPMLARHPEIEALSFQRLVPLSARAAYEQARQGQQPDFRIRDVSGGTIHPAAVRGSYDVIEFIEPTAGNSWRLGLDSTLALDPGMARERSRTSGSVAASDLLQLLPRGGQSNGFVLVAPVFRPGAALRSVAQRRRAVIGETAAVLRIEPMLATILAARGFAADDDMALSVYSGGARHVPAFRNGAALAAIAPLAAPALAWPGWLWYDRATPLSASFDVAGSMWHMTVARAPQPFAAMHNGSFYALLGGLLFSLLLTAYVCTLVSRAVTIERVARERTAALQFANLRLSEDLAQRMHTEKSLRLREQMIEVSANAIILCSADGPDYVIEYVNPAFQRITGYAKADVAGHSLDFLHGTAHDQQGGDDIRAAMSEKREGRALLRNYRKDGSSYWNELYVAPVSDENGAISHFVVAQYDITEVMRYEAELGFQARHDTLTGLANRKLLAERLTDNIAGADHHGGTIWVAFLDLDRFKFVNDTLGHDAGDILLKQLALRLQAAGREIDTVARVGGDEFVLVLPQISGDGGPMAVLQRMIAAVAEPLAVEGHEFFLTCSIGVAVYSADGKNADSLVKHADVAMYRAKEKGRNNIQFYDQAMSQRTQDRVRLEADLRHALARDQFVLHYQPQLDLNSGQVVGMESLIRWQHPVLGLLGPDRFIGLAEEMGLIGAIGAWVIHTACAQTVAWHQAGLGNLRVAVNLSPRQFTEKGLAKHIADVLLTTGLDARYLELELTESMVMTDVDSAVTILRRLKGLGCHISIDDFGTGYSSLSYLRRFPLDVLKIDRSFIGDLKRDVDAAAIVVAIISLAHSLRLKVIAEGVETQEQMDFLQTHGCDQIQGYHFSRPVGANTFERLLEERRCLPQLAQG